MQRSEVVNAFLKLYDDPSYLEVGVDEGTTFFAVEAGRKVAVDPAFKFAIPESVGAHAGTEFHAVPSDVYFAASATERFDVIFLDGLHTFEQILKDFNNALNVIKPDGVIIVDDVIPSSYYASLPDLEMSLDFRRRLGFTDWDWMGDVYKIIYLIESFYQGHRFATVLENQGQTIVWPEARPASALPTRTIEQIGRMTYHEAILLDGYNLQSCQSILDHVRQTVIKK